MQCSFSDCQYRYANKLVTTRSAIDNCKLQSAMLLAAMFWGRVLSIALQIPVTPRVCCNEICCKLAVKRLD
eukprot:1141941-Pelagomonas_calceolata.AAC.2